MYKRRLQKMGAASLGVSLPKKWLRHYRLKQGDEVDIEVLPDYTLLIRPSFVKSHAGYSCQVFKYDDSSPNASIMRLVSLYINGVDSIKVLCGSTCNSFKEKIYRLLERNIIGLEIIEEGEGYITVACLVDILSLPLSEVLRKMGRLVPAMMRDVESSITSGTELDIEERDSLIDKLYLYSVRQLNMVMQGRLLLEKTGLKSMGEAISIANLLKILERMGDHAAQLYRWSRSRPHSVDSRREAGLLLGEVRAAAEKILGEYLAALENPEEMPSLEDTIMELRMLEDKVRKPGLDPSLVISLTRIIAYLRDVAEVVTDIVVSREMQESTCSEGLTTDEQ